MNENIKTDHERRNPIFEQVVDQVRIPFDSLGIDGVVATAQGDDTRPSDGKAI